MPEIREIWDAINCLKYKDEPDYALIRSRLKDIFHRTQCINRMNVNTYENIDDHYMRQPQPQLMSPQFSRMSDINMGMSKPLKYLQDSIQNQM